MAHGLYGQPTNLNNVETYATVPWIINHSAKAFAAMGTKTSNGTKYVLVVDPRGQSTRKTVTVGVSDDSYTQIVSGIAEGASVSTGASTASSSGSTTTKRSTGGLFGGPPGGGSGPPAGGPGGN